MLIDDVSDGLSHDFTLFAHDDGAYNTGTRLVRLVRDNNFVASEDFEYVLEYRRDQAGNNTYVTWDRGLLLHWRERGGGDSYETHILDMAPETSNDWKDGGLRIGKTLTDTEGEKFTDIHITAVSEVAGAIPGLRVVIHLNSAAGNSAPDGSISQTYADVNTDITLTATQTDPDGDTVFDYFWDFGDGTYSLDGLATQTRQWSTPGYHSVSWTISDCKGGVDVVTYLVYVGPQPDGVYAEATAASAAPSGSTPYQFNVLYRSATDVIDFSTIDNADITVSGPDAFSTTASLVSVNLAGDGAERIATYQMTPPGGSWDPTDTGTYTITMLNNAVGSTAGYFAEAGDLTTLKSFYFHQSLSSCCIIALTTAAAASSLIHQGMN